MKSYTMMYGYIEDKENDKKVDEVIVSYMKAPHTYTKEDIVEINCHGGMVSVKKVLSLVIQNGARMAEPGEFTKRAFLNGRIDLSEAEAVIDLIRAKTDESMEVALSQVEGKLSQKVDEISDELLKLLSHIEAVIDYPEEGVEEIENSTVLEMADDINSKIEKLIKGSDTGKILRDGLNAVIAGKPNVGKSSLLNELIDESRAIVTDVPGTTRDVIEEYINIDGIPVKLVDTAGIRETSDIVESMGVKKTKEYIEKSDIAMFVVDISRKLEKEDFEIIDMIKGRNAFVIANKCDIGVDSETDSTIKDLNLNVIYTSMKDKRGIDDVKNEISSFVYKGKASVKDVLVTNVRHKNILIDAKKNMDDGIETIKSGMPLDMASIEFKDAYLDIGKITGKNVSEDIVNKIFDNFCVGK